MNPQPRLYVHAIAIEREAAERYAQFAERMAELDQYKVAAFFRMLSAFRLSLGVWLRGNSPV